MAGPLSSEEIEDVVSSVRRLVSNEQKPRTLSRDLNAERLLLTPALRVVPETSPLAPLVLDLPVLDALPPDAPPDAVALGEVAAAAPAGNAEARAEQAPEDSLAETMAMDVDPEPPVAEGDLAAAVAPDASAPMATDVEAEWEDEIWADPGVVSLGEAALAAEDAEVLTAPPSGADLPEAGNLDDAPAESAGSDWAEGEAVPFLPLRRRAEHLAARVAAGEVVESLRGDAENQLVTAPADSPASASDLSPTQPPEADARSDSRATELLDADGTPLAVLDEASLQELVRQTLRVELQGDLGERITRNVRKLVRAEINRALLARDLD